MPSLGFYMGVYFGFIAGMVLFFAATSSYIPENHNATAAGIGALIMFVFGSIAGVATFMDLRPMYREWNIKRKLNDMELEEQEQEVERRKREHEKESKSETEYDTHSTENSEVSSSPSPSAEDHEEFPKTEWDDEPLLKTGGRVSSKLKREQEIETPEIVESGEKESAEEEYIRSIMADTHLRYLLLLYDTPEGYIVNASEVVRQEEGKLKGEDVSGRKRQEMNSKMKDLKHAKLVEISMVKEDITHKKINKYEITKLGREYFDKLWDEKIKTWADFMEKYGKEIYGKK